MKQVTITINVPEDCDVRVDYGGTTAIAAAEVPTDEVVARVETGKRSMRAYMQEYVARVAAELGCSTIVPGGKREDYLNTFPPATLKHKRVSSLTVTSGRLEVYCDPFLAERYPPAKQDLHNEVPVQVKIYLGSEEAVDAAVSLTRHAIEQLRDED